MRAWPFALVLVACGGSTAESFVQSDNLASVNVPAEACATLPAGPFQPASVGQPFNGSEDFVFDGRGGVIGKRGNALVRVDAEGGSTTLAELPGQTYGLRFHPNGNLIAAIPGSGKIVSVSPGGVVTTLATGLASPNGVHVDPDGNIWVTEFRGGKVVRFAPDLTKSDVVTGLDAPNGVVVDAVKHALYYTEYARGKIWRLALDGAEAAPTLVATITGASLDGLTLDTCGNLYAVDNGRFRLYRVRGGKVEELAKFPTNVANAQFGAGEGFDPSKLYVTGNPGTLYVLPLGVPQQP